MILGPISLLDCFVFLVFLAPQLIIKVGFFPTLFCGLQALPFLRMYLPIKLGLLSTLFISLFYSSLVSSKPSCWFSLVVKLPLGLIYERILLSRKSRSPFAQQATFFEDFIIRLVRYAFAEIPASIGRVFFSKPVALPFLRFRMLRHGYFTSPIHWHEVKQVITLGSLIWLENMLTQCRMDLKVCGSLQMRPRSLTSWFIMPMVRLFYTQENFEQPWSPSSEHPSMTSLLADTT